VNRRQLPELLMDSVTEKRWLLLAFGLKRKRIKGEKKKGMEVRKSERERRKC
jgi:hypothetical protein